MQIKAFLAAALYSSVAFAIEFTTFPPINVQAGQSVTVTWIGETAGQPVTILLRQGPSTDLQTIRPLTTTATGGSYTFTLPTSTTNGAGYALQLVQGSQENYSTQFSVSGGSSASASPTNSSVVSSISASVSSVLSSLSASVSSASSLTSAASATSSRPTSSSTTSASSTRASASAAPTNGAAASNVQSPLALIMGAAAAMLYLH